ncbi:nitric-oxide reductase large subunit [Aquiflexum gelatinilyticum]|uniref:Cbb3-type cytochrome c oxidase subunit I n=1 Tax=Aquiflexum gelatinilyticum TaxID=2961943 RepID=A0A9X2P5F8_9BACT|nr:cbb3-type cytochrome c oxidase subunit I [Aquiflexum gelatinilyticum]MCR9013872.1 cbb3-type cytochrome c oxidase subunit I [Aquiflexum gelatinilyticum]
MKPESTFLNYLMNPKNWWVPFLVIFVISIAGLTFIGYQTYTEAPPIPNFVDSDGNRVVSKEQILSGQEVFHRYALMEYGSMFGDGALRGPDFTAQALHENALAMKSFYSLTMDKNSDDRGFGDEGVLSIVQKEIKNNTYDPSDNSVEVTDAQVYGIQAVQDFYIRMFTDPTFKEGFQPSGYITDEQELRDLGMFFYWGSWVCSVSRPGYKYSYTHNWPYDEFAGNLPTPSTLIWSIVGLLGLVLGLGLVMYYYGQFEQLNQDYLIKGASEMVTEDKLKSFRPSPTQRATFKFFYVAMILFLVQVLAGVLTVHDFVGFTKYFGWETQELLPITISRSWHVQLSLFWISACWVGISFFVLPLLANKEPKGQLTLINLLFWVFFVMVAGTVIGLFMGPKGMMGEYSRWLGHQGWEFVELGRLYQYMLLSIFTLWALIVYQGVKGTFKPGMPWGLPNWLVYSICCILLLLLSGFVASPETNFVIADFWRWMVVHMWVEAFFEVFTTIIVGYMMVMMGLVNRQAVVKVVYLSALLFLGSGLMGISHNFYWNAKPVATLALGSVFSTLQVVPLILLTLEAWKMQKMPYLLGKKEKSRGKSSLFAMPGVFLFILGVTFWNFFGAGVFGLIINLPIANYYEHGTYLTVNHGHAALMGVYGNLSIAAILFCLRFLIKPEKWNDSLIKTAFWSINIGLLLMVALDLFPAGIHQLVAVMENGYWYARSQEFIQSVPFQSFTWLRLVGGSVFCLGGLFPLTWFVLRSARDLKKSSPFQESVVKEEKEEIVA